MAPRTVQFFDTPPPLSRVSGETPSRKKRGFALQKQPDGPRPPQTLVPSESRAGFSPRDPSTVRNSDRGSAAELAGAQAVAGEEVVEGGAAHPGPGAPPDLERVADKVLFGSDWPSVPTIKKNIEAVGPRPPAPGQDQAQILGDNAARLLNLGD